MLKKANIVELIDLIVATVQLLKLLKGRDSMKILKLTTSNMEEPDVSKTGAQVCEALNNRVVKFQWLKTSQDFACNL